MRSFGFPTHLLRLALVIIAFSAVLLSRPASAQDLRERILRFSGSFLMVLDGTAHVVQIENRGDGVFEIESLTGNEAIGGTGSFEGTNLIVTMDRDPRYFVFLMPYGPDPEIVLFRNSGIGNSAAPYGTMTLKRL